MISFNHQLIIGCFVIIGICYCEGAVANANHHNVSRKGVCTLEVPTIDLLSEEDKRGGIPRGNGSREGFSRIEVCCSGWQRKPHSHYECEPICENGCENGNCTAPNVCTCKQGHIKFAADKCIPTCPIGCLNGVCTVRGTCECHYGFTLSPDGRYCQATCHGGCGQGGECVGPDMCKCRPGFTLNRENKCDFHCENGCGGGTCIGPNKCSCKPGFKMIGNVCQAECPRGCRNGECTAPGVCSCKQGWNIDKTGTACEPHCSLPCLNADCTEPEVCTCKQGYTKDTRSNYGNKCVAHCPNGCPNGTCSAPNFCICNPGFVKEGKGSNNCIRRMKRSISSFHWDLIPEQYVK